MPIDTDEKKLALTHWNRRGIPFPNGTTTLSEGEKSHMLGFLADVSLIVLDSTPSTEPDDGVLYWGGSAGRRRGGP